MCCLRCVVGCVLAVVRSGLRTWEFGSPTAAAAWAVGTAHPEGPQEGAETGTKARGQRQMLTLTARDRRSASATRSRHGSVMGGRGPVCYASLRRHGLPFSAASLRTCGQEVAAARCGRQVGEQESHPSGPRHRGDRHGVALSHGEQCSAECQPCTSCRAEGDSPPEARTPG